MTRTIIHANAHTSSGVGAKGRRTYAAPGLRDLRLRLRGDGCTVAVDFAGGRTDGYTVTAATYTTDDPLVQRLIEESKAFATGKIVAI